jgi:phage replication O-like protein O
MSDTTSYRFVRVPTTFLEAILQLRLNGTQWCIIFWVLRQTLGWNRQTAPFTWYRVAKELGLDRGGVVRAAHHLIRAGLVYQGAGEVGIQTDPAQWKTLTPVEKTLAGTNVNDDARPRKAMIPVSASDVRNQRFCVGLKKEVKTD